MSDHLNKKEIDQLLDLFNKIKLDLSDDSFPTRTNRSEAVVTMKKVLEIHNYVVSEYDPDKGIWVEPSKSEREEGKKPEDGPSPFMADARDQHLINQNFNKATGGK